MEQMASSQTDPDLKDELATPHRKLALKEDGEFLLRDRLQENKQHPGIIRLRCVHRRV